MEGEEHSDHFKGEPTDSPDGRGPGHPLTASSSTCSVSSSTSAAVLSSATSHVELVGVWIAEVRLLLFGRTSRRTWRRRATISSVIRLGTETGDREGDLLLDGRQDDNNADHQRASATVHRRQRQRIARPVPRSFSSPCSSHLISSLATIANEPSLI